MERRRKKVSPGGKRNLRRFQIGKKGLKKRDETLFTKKEKRK